MRAERRRELILGAVLAVLVVVVYRAWSQMQVEPAAPSGSPVAAGGRRAPAVTAQTEGAQSVRLDALDREHPKPSTAERDLFRFRPTPQPAPLPGAITGRGPQQPGQTGPPGPPQPAVPPPIALKFIGFVDQGPGKPKAAWFTDGLGPPLLGIEGGTVAGRYRIVRIGVESTELEYLDGRGRQTIRLSGS
jgi:hypothetical protein